MTVRSKGKKRKIATSKLSIDELHKSQYNELNNNNNLVKELNEKKKQINKELKLLKQNTLKPSNLPKMSIEVKIWKLEEEVDNINKEIENLKKKESLYLLKSSKLLKQYYKNIKEREKKLENINDNKINNNAIPKSANKFSIFDKLEKAAAVSTTNKKTERKNNKQNNSEQNNNEQNEKEDNKSNDYISMKKLYNNYMKIINPKYINKVEYDVINACKNCGDDMYLNYNNGIYNCNNCGLCQNVIIDTDKQNHKDPPKEMTSFSYRRINHLNEILSQIQGKETTDIPDEIYDAVYKELNKERFTDISKLTTNKLKKILKKIGESKYYEHIPYMVIQMGGIPPPVISPEVEEIIRDIFLKTQHPFNNCDKERVNFINYTGVLYKIFELLDLDHYLKNFKFLKDDKKQYQQEQIWKQICKELNWEFIATS